MTTTRHLFGMLLGGSASTLALLAGTTAVAAEDNVIAEIIVTAQKRREVLLDVPQSVTVVDGGALERQQAANFQDYLKLVPGLQLNQDTPGVGRLVLRGINTGGVASTVAVSSTRRRSAPAAASSTARFSQATSTRSTCSASRCCAVRRARCMAPVRSAAC